MAHLLQFDHEACAYFEAAVFIRFFFLHLETIQLGKSFLAGYILLVGRVLRIVITHCIVVTMVASMRPSRKLLLIAPGVIVRCRQPKHPRGDLVGTFVVQGAMLCVHIGHLAGPI